MSSEATLERRYRRLLKLYPQEHRREYEEEMIGVLLAGAAPGRRGPGPREVVDLVVAALAARRLRGSAGLRDESWHRAARAVQLFGAILLLAVGLHRATMGAAVGFRFTDHVQFVNAHESVRPAAWALVLLFVLVGWRWAAVPAALAALVAEVVPPVELYRDTPALLLNVYWILTASRPGSTRRPRRRQPRWWRR